LFRSSPNFSAEGFSSVEVGQVGLIGLPEIERVRQAGAHHLAIAVRDLLAAVLGLDVGGEDEMVGERFLRVRLAARGGGSAPQNTSGWRGWSGG
jgi:hypothetical protein